MRWQGLRAVRRAPALRRRGQHGEVPRRQGVVGGGQRLPAVPRRLRLRRRIRRRAQVPRDAALPGGADLDQPDPVATSPSTCSACRGRSDAAPLDGITVVTLEHAIAAPFCTRQLADLGARVIKVERPGSGDFARALRRARARPGVALRLDQPLEGKPDARRQASAGGSEVLQRLRRRGRRAGAEPRARRGRAARAVASRRCRAAHPRLIVCDISGYGDDGSRPVPRQEGLRPADPERVGLPLGHRHARRAGQGRLLDRRHRRRHVRVHQHPRRADRSAARPGTGCRIDVSMLESMVEWMSYPLYYAYRRRRAAAARRRGARDDLSLRPVPGRRRQDGDARAAERARVAGRSATRCCEQPGARRPTRASRPTRSARAAREALRAIIVAAFAGAHRRAGHRAARRGADRQRAASTT